MERVIDKYLLNDLIDHEENGNLDVTSINVTLINRSLTNYGHVFIR